MAQISPYLGYPVWQTPYVGGDVLKCPAYPTLPEWQTYTANGDLWDGPNAVTSMVQVPHPAQTVLLFDGNDGGVADTSVAVRWNSHNGKANFLMMDGSAAAFTSTSDLNNASSPYWNPRK